MELKKCPFTKMNYLYIGGKVFIQADQVPDHAREDFVKRIGYLDTLKEDQIDSMISFFLRYCGADHFIGTEIEDRADRVLLEIELGLLPGKEELRYPLRNVPEEEIV